MLRLMLLTLSSDGISEGDNGERADGDDYTHQDFLTMSLRDVEEISGVARPVNRTAEEHQEYREKAWHSYQQDISNRDEWGNARQGQLEPASPEELPKEIPE